MRRSIIYFICILALWSQQARAQEPMPLGLKDAMEYAVKHNGSAKNARLDVLIQKAKNAEVTGMALPQVSGRAEYDYYLKLPKTFIDASSFPGGGDSSAGVLELEFGQKHTTSAAISLSQTLFNGSILVALQARDAVLDLARKSAQLTEEGVRYNVQRSYYGLVVAKRQFNILTSSLSNARASLNDVSIMYKNGFAEKIEVDRSSVQVNNLATDSLRTANILIVSEQLLKYQMGMDIAQPIVLVDTSLEASLLNINGDINGEFDYGHRTDYSLLQTQLKVNEYDLKRHKYSGLPSLNGIFNVGYNYASNYFDRLFDRFPYNSLAGIQLNVPIFDGLQRRNRVKQAKFAIEKTNNSISDLKLNIDFQIAQSRSTVKNSLLAMESQQRNMELANTVLDLSRKKYKAGVGSNLEVNQAQIELLQAQNNYFQSMLDVFNAQTEFQRALGQFK